MEAAWKLASALASVLSAIEVLDHHHEVRQVMGVLKSQLDHVFLQSHPTSFQDLPFGR